jgi:hypothetical protein
MKTQRHPTTLTAIVLALLVVATAVVGGCAWAPELSRICRDIEHQLPGASFDKQFAISLGPLSLGFAKLVTGMVPDAREARGYLDDVSRIQVAIYDTEGMPPLDGIKMPSRLREMQKDGWEIAVKAREEDSVVWVMYKIEDDSIREMYVVVLDEDELVLVKARGRLERLAARALNEARFARGVPDMGDVDGDWHSDFEPH